MDHWRTLGLARDASANDVKTAFRKLALQLHPDRHSNSTPHARAEAANKFKLITEAYEVLSDDKLRAAYQSRTSGSHSHSSSRGASGGAGASAYGYGSGSYYSDYNTGFNPSSGKRGRSPFARARQAWWASVGRTLSTRRLEVVLAVGITTAAGMAVSSIDSLWEARNQGKSFEAMQSRGLGSRGSSPPASGSSPLPRPGPASGGTSQTAKPATPSQPAHGPAASSALPSRPASSSTDVQPGRQRSEDAAGGGAAGAAAAAAAMLAGRWSSSPPGQAAAQGTAASVQAGAPSAGSPGPGTAAAADGSSAFWGYMPVVGCAARSRPYTTPLQSSYGGPSQGGAGVGLAEPRQGATPQQQQQLASMSLSELIAWEQAAEQGQEQDQQQQPHPAAGRTAVPHQQASQGTMGTRLPVHQGDERGHGIQPVVSQPRNGLPQESVHTDPGVGAHHHRTPAGAAPGPQAGSRIARMEYVPRAVIIPAPSPPGQMAGRHWWPAQQPVP